MSERVDLIEWLIAKQGEQTGAEFCKTLGVSASTWSRMRSRVRPLNKADLGLFVEIFPGESDEIIAMYRNRRAA